MHLWIVCVQASARSAHVWGYAFVMRACAHVCVRECALCKPFLVIVAHTRARLSIEAGPHAKSLELDSQDMTMCGSVWALHNCPPSPTAHCTHGHPHPLHTARPSSLTCSRNSIVAGSLLVCPTCKQAHCCTCPHHSGLSTPGQNPSYAPSPVTPSMHKPSTPIATPLDDAATSLLESYQQSSWAFARLSPAVGPEEKDKAGATGARRPIMLPQRKGEGVMHACEQGGTACSGWHAAMCMHIPCPSIFASTWCACASRHAQTPTCVLSTHLYRQSYMHAHAKISKTTTPSCTTHQSTHSHVHVLLHGFSRLSRVKLADAVPVVSWALALTSHVHACLQAW